MTLSPYICPTGDGLVIVYHDDGTVRIDWPKSLLTPCPTCQQKLRLLSTTGWRWRPSWRHPRTWRLLVVLLR